MPYTTEDLVLDVLSELQAGHGSGQPVSAEDSDKITRRLGGIFATLATRNIIALDEASIDDDAYDALVKYVAEIVAPAVASRPTDEAARRAAEDTLRTVYRSPRGITQMLKVDCALTFGQRRYRGV